MITSNVNSHKPNWFVEHSQLVVVGAICFLLLSVATGVAIEQGGLTPKIESSTTAAPSATTPPSDQPYPAPHAGGPDEMTLRSFLLESDRQGGTPVCDSLGTHGIEFTVGLYSDLYSIQNHKVRPDHKRLQHTIEKYCK